MEPETLIYPDIMVDIETTGLRMDRHAVIQIAAVRFNFETRKVDTNTFDRCLRIPTTRFWDEGTRQWWMQHREVLAGIVARMEDPALVLQDFQDWAKEASFDDRRMWAKNAGFDYQFLGSYFHDFSIMNPVHYRNCVDIGSFLRGYYDTAAKAKYTPPPFEGAAHNAIFDCLNQINELFSAMDQRDNAERTVSG